MKTELSTVQEERLVMDLQPMRSFMRPSLVSGIIESIGKVLRAAAAHDQLVHTMLTHRSDSIRRALIGTLARRVVVTEGQKLLDFMDQHASTSLADAAEHMANRLDDEAQAAYRAWQEERLRVFRPVEALPEEPRNDVDRMLKMLDEYQPSAPLVSYAAVRNADYFSMEPQHVVNPSGDEPSVVQETYDPTVISGEAVAHAINHDIRAFSKATEEGFFVYPYNYGGQHSVRHVFNAGLRRRRRKNEENFNGKMLLGPDSKPISWLTYNQMPDNPNERCLKGIRRYLEKGVTGHVDYIDRSKQAQLMANAKLIQRFDTIWVHPAARGAGLRLFAKATRNMLDETPRLRQGGFLDLYIIRSLLFHSTDADVQHLRDFPLPLGPNTKSLRFFTDCGMSVIAYDNGRSDRNRTERKIGAEERRVFLYPEWQRLLGLLADVHTQISKRYREFQWSHGDYTEDIEFRSPLFTK